MHVQIDECFIKAVRNESRQRRERFRSIQSSYGLDDDLLEKFERIGIFSEEKCPKIKMKKRVVRTLLSV